MVIGIIHPGSGLGDSLFSYIATRDTALRLGVDFGFVGKEFFKGTFMSPDWGKDVDLKYHIEYPAGKLVVDEPHTLYEADKPYYDPEFNFIQDSTVIDGTGAQDIRYFEHIPPRLILFWLNIDPNYLEHFYDIVCVINFRGGEFKLFPDLYLTKEYWNEAVELIRKEGIDDDHFLVVTDDVEEAQRFFPNFKVTHDIANDWTSILKADYLIIPNSAFPILPALMNEQVRKVIAPRYWARRNIGIWSQPQNYYSKFTYI